MPINTSVPRSPGWWAEKLGNALWRRRTGHGWSNTTAPHRRGRPGLDLLQSYVDGDPPLPHVADGWKAALWPYIRQARMNYAELVKQAPLDRMGLLGFGTAVDDDRSGDDAAAELFDANDLGLKFLEAAGHMLTLGDGYMMVGRPPGSETPLITAEDPRETITAEDPATGRTIAGLKRVRDEWDARDLVYVLTPGRVDVAVRKGRSTLDGGPVSFGLAGDQWSWDEKLSGSFPAGFEDLLPLHRFRNRNGVGEFEPHLDVLDRINDTIFDRLIIQKYQAMRQRAAIGLPDVYPEGHPRAGQEIDYADAFLADPGAFWQMPPGVTMWESSPFDFGPIRLLVKDDAEGLCAVTATPLYYTVPDAASGSAEGASTQREAFIYRVENRRAHSRSPLAGTMADAFRMDGDTARAVRRRIRPLWAPAERHSLTERMSAAAQAKAAGLPQESVYTDVMGYSPRDLPRLQAERARDLLYAPLVPELTPAPQPAGTAARTPAAPRRVPAAELEA